MINAFLITLISGLSTMLGTLFIFIKIDENKIYKFITFTLSFSMAIMIGLSIFELIPTSFFNIIYNYGVEKGQYLIFFIIILGYFLVNIIIHKLNSFKTNDLYKLGLLSCITLIIHNLPEGIAVFSSAYSDITLGLKLAIAVTLHNIPEGIIISIPIYYSTKSKKKAILYTLIASLAEPLGALITYIFFKDLISISFIDLTLLFVGIIMILISIKELLPKAQSYKENKYLNIGFIVGLILVIINLLME